MEILPIQTHENTFYTFDGIYFIAYKSEKILYGADAVSTIHESPDLKSQSQQNSKDTPYSHLLGVNLYHSPKFECKL